jgi:hypothetical protein
MKPSTLLPAVLYALLPVYSATAHAQASAPASAPTSQDGAATACQRAAQATLQRDRPSVVSVSFGAPPKALPSAADADNLVLRGAGRALSASGSRAFSYSCNYNTQTRSVGGVIVRDAAGVERKPARRSVEPDLRNISPSACESSAASTLKRRWPSVQGIVFDGDTRQLSSDAPGRALLQGQGQATLQTGGPLTHFSYDCQLDESTGRVTGLRIKP